MAVRPNAATYQQALDFYRTDTAIETIGERLGLDADTLEQLENEGWPATAREPELPALRLQVLERLTRIRAGQLDTYAQLVEAAAETSKTRKRTAVLASQIENAILSAWAARVTKATSGKAKTMDTVELDQLVVPASVRESLLALRRAQDPSHDRRYIEIFRRMSERDENENGNGESWEDAIMRDLSGLTPEELEHYVETREKPKRQRELPFPKPPTGGEQAA
jgi:alkylated DNA nucleotide flippase Atl1